MTTGRGVWCVITTRCSSTSRLGDSVYVTMTSGLSSSIAFSSASEQEREGRDLVARAAQAFAQSLCALGRLVDNENSHRCDLANRMPRGSLTKAGTRDGKPHRAGADASRDAQPCRMHLDRINAIR